MITVRLLHISSYRIDQSKQYLAACLFSIKCYNEEHKYGDHFVWESKLKDSFCTGKQEGNNLKNDHS